MVSFGKPRRSSPTLFSPNTLDSRGAHRQRVGQHVLGDHAVAADERVPSNAAKLMHAAERLNHRPILDDHVAGERDGVSQLRVIADLGVVRHMHVGHQQIVGSRSA